MLSVCDQPTTINYETLLNHYFKGADCIEEIKAKLINSIKYDGVLDDISIGPMKIVPKDSFFIRVTSLIAKYTKDFYHRIYKEKESSIDSRIEKAISWLGVILYTHLADIEDIQLARYKITINDPFNQPIYRFDDADLSFLIKHYHSGMLYHDALTTCGQIHGYIMTSDYLCNYAAGLRRTLNLLSCAAINVRDMHDLYTLKIEIHHPEKGKNE